MPASLLLSFQRLSAVALMAAAVGLTGCGTNVETAGAPAAVPGRAIAGHVHGGVFPIQNATIRLMVTQSSTEFWKDSSGTEHFGGTYGGNNSADPLLVTTSDANGYFTFPDTGWSCNTDQFAYITATGGHSSNLSGSTQNANVVQVGVVGSCADFYSGATFSQSKVDNINVFLTEVSTVAAAYALGNFATIDNTNAATGQQVVNISSPDRNNVALPSCTVVASGLTCTASGLGHGFANAYNLVDSVRFDGSFPTGNARSSTPNNADSEVPYPILNTIGNILQNCVDSLGGGVAGDGSYCGTLFTDATPPAGRAPTDTLQVALNMAKNPTNNITALYNLQTRTAYFAPYLNAAPTSFTVSFFYGATASGSYVPYPVDLALDASDSVYVLYAHSGSASTNTGTGTANTSSAVFALYASGSTQYYGSANTSILYPSQIAVASGGRVYVTNNDTYTSTNGGIFATSTTGTLTRVASLPYAAGVALDQNNNVWISTANSATHSINEYFQATLNQPNGSAVPDFHTASLGVSVAGLAVDQSQNIWGVSSSPGSGKSDVVVLANTGTVGSPVYPASGTGGIASALSSYNGFGVALNAAGTAFLPTYEKIESATYSTSASTISVDPDGSESNSAGNVPHRAEVDGAGNLFFADNEGSGLLYIYTPPAAAVTGSSNCTGTGGTSSATTGCLSTGALVSFFPCFPYPTSGGIQCITTNNSSSVYTPSNLRGIGIDSAGDVWYAADSAYGTVIETLGLAAPTWPQLSYGHPGVMPQ